MLQASRNLSLISIKQKVMERGILIPLYDTQETICLESECLTKCLESENNV